MSHLIYVHMICAPHFVLYCPLLTLSLCNATRQKASRNEIIELLAAKKHLEAEINSLTEEVELLERSAARCIEAEIKLQRITDAQSANYEDFLQLVHENEETLDLIRVRLLVLLALSSIQIAYLYLTTYLLSP